VLHTNGHEGSYTVQCEKGDDVPFPNGTALRWLFALFLRLGVLYLDHTVNATACFPFCGNLHPHWIADAHKIIENLIGYGFVKDTPSSKVEVVVFERLEFNADLARYVLNRDGAKVR